MKTARTLSLIAFVVASGVVVASALTQPQWNFDAVGYVGAASTGTPAERQRQSYDAIAAAAPAEQANAISSSSDYRRRFSSDPEAFVAGLPIYRFKWGYVALVKVAWRLGLNPADATHWISTTAYAVLALALLAWLIRERVEAVGVLLAGALVVAPPMGELAGLSTPDMLVTLLVSLGAALVLRERRRALGVAALSLAGLVRPDAALNSVVLLLVLSFADRSFRSFDTCLAKNIRSRSAVHTLHDV